ncbi:MAG: glycosyltransferase family 2 protein [Chloroflexi bacterium]|nr:glycosyltransferase family 2 protein [Chloroflexota bacterium]
MIIPVYNEESRIGSTLEQVAAFLGGWPNSWEVVVADDGSTDGTAQIVDQFVAAHAGVQLLRLPHRGKGWAVKNGMLAAKGKYRLFCDADLSVPIEQVDRLLPSQCEDTDVAIGSREAPGAKRYGEPQRRHLMGRVYNAIVRWLAIPGLKDTQCGFKCFRGEIVPQLFQKQTIDGFGFDVEVLFLARRAGMKLQEVGVDWYYRERSKVRPFHDSIAMTRDLLKIRWHHRKARFGQASIEAPGDRSEP